MPFTEVEGSAELGHELPDDGRLETRGEVGAALGSPLAEVADRVDERRSLSPLKPKSMLSCAIAIGIANAWVAVLGFSPIAGPPGNPRPSSRAALSRASPAVSSSVWPAIANLPSSRTSASSVRPPLAIRARKGGSIGSALEVGGGDVALEVVDGDQRLAGGGRERLRGVDADQQGADQPGLFVTAIASIGIEAVAGVLERRVDHRVDQLQMPARGDLGNDAAAEAGVEAGLAERRRC
ncbi:MAG: hypothetical protein U0R51_03080 [Solirubrobacterales bacterium]